jgi:hypothetical protein
VCELVFLKPYLSGSLLPPFSTSLAMQIFVLFLLVLDLLGVSLVYFMCTWVVLLALLMIFIYL